MDNQCCVILRRTGRQCKNKKYTDAEMCKTHISYAEFAYERDKKSKEPIFCGNHYYYKYAWGYPFSHRSYYFRQ